MKAKAASWMSFSLNNVLFDVSSTSATWNGVSTDVRLSMYCSTPSSKIRKSRFLRNGMNLPSRSMTLAGMLTRAVSILIVPVSSTVTGVLSARGRLEILSLSESCWTCPWLCDAGVGFRPDCAELDELNTQTNPATNKITTKQRANRLLFIIPPRRCPRALIAPGIFARLWRALTERGEPAGPDHLSFVIGHLSFVICQRPWALTTNDE